MKKAILILSMLPVMILGGCIDTSIRDNRGNQVSTFEQQAINDCRNNSGYLVKMYNYNYPQCAFSVFEYCSITCSENFKNAFKDVNNTWGSNAQDKISPELSKCIELCNK